MPETTPSRLPTDSVTVVPCTSMTSPATRGNSATIWFTIACSGADEAVGACRAGVWAHGSETPQRIARRTASATNAAALRRFIRDTISLSRDNNGARRFPPGPVGTTQTTRLEAEPHASRSDQDVVDITV